MDDWTHRLYRDFAPDLYRIARYRLGDEALLPAPEGGGTLDEVLPTQLAEADKQLLKWFYEEGLSYRDLSARLGVPTGICGTWLYRARARCKKLLEQGGLVMPLTHSPEVSAQVGSLTVRVLQTVQDTMTFYVLFSLELPEDEVFPEDVSSLSTHIIGTDPIDASTGAGIGYSQIVEQSPHRLVVLHDLTGSGMEDMEGSVKLWFPVDVKVWYNEDKYYKIFSRKPLVLRWQAPSVQAVRTWTPEVPVQDGELTLSKVQLSPLSVSFTLDGTDIVAAPVPVTLTFQDGSVWEVPEHAREMVEDMSSTLNDGSGRMRHVYDYRFDRPIDLETVAGVRVGEVELS
ncbi:MAG: sigma-70 family RNA polymerase sigma factor [Ruminiclostridium sp.]|jgi:hypothetical protein|nr:sigma-70 family RNA polymerase sigma factor [Ruminiclostridium sp.]